MAMGFLKMVKNSLITLLAATIILSGFQLYKNFKLEKFSFEDKKEGRKEILVYFHNSSLQKDQNDCGEVFAVSRVVSEEEPPARSVLEQLLQGPTVEEKNKGFSSFFSDNTWNFLKSVKIAGATAYVNLEDLRSVIPNASSSCGSQSFLSEMKKTLTQFPEIKRVIFAINGRTNDFYEWLQIGCGAENDGCNNKPFELID